MWNKLIIYILWIFHDPHWIIRNCRFFATFNCDTKSHRPLLFILHFLFQWEWVSRSHFQGSEKLQKFYIFRMFSLISSPSCLCNWKWLICSKHTSLEHLIETDYIWEMECQPEREKGWWIEESSRNQLKALVCLFGMRMRWAFVIKESLDTDIELPKMSPRLHK